MSDKAPIVIHSYADSSVLITGGTSGVGLASAIQFAQTQRVVGKAQPRSAASTCC